MAEEERARSRPDSGPDRFDDLLRARDREADGCSRVPRAEVSANMLPGEVERTVFEVGRQHLVARLQAERPRRDIDRSSRVLDEDQIVRIRAYVSTERGARFASSSRAGGRETEPLALQLELPSW